MEIAMLAINLMTALLGGLVAVLGMRFKFKKGVALVLTGALLVVVATLGIPGNTLKSLKAQVGVSADEVTALEDDSAVGDDSADDDSATEEKMSSGGMAIIDCDLLVPLLEALRIAVENNPTIAAAVSDEPASAEQMTESTPELITPEEPEPTPSPARDPFVAPAIIEPQRERSLPEEPKTGEPKCSSPSLLHGPSGGPAQNGCYAIGCNEGYALPMKLLPDRWVACTDPMRFERIEDCYYFHDSDGSEQSVRLNDGSWVPCK